MACKDCGKQATTTLPCRTFRATLATLELDLCVRGAVTPTAFLLLQDWFGLVYEALRPTDERVLHDG